jgi:hypothetical protein
VDEGHVGIVEGGDEGEVAIDVIGLEAAQLHGHS